MLFKGRNPLGQHRHQALATDIVGGLPDRAQPGQQQSRLKLHRPAGQDHRSARLGALPQGTDGRLAMIAQQLHGLINQLPFMFRTGGFIAPPQLLQYLFPGHLIHVFIHSGHGNPTSGTTNHFPSLHTPARVTKLLAQFVLGFWL